MDSDRVAVFRPGPQLHQDAASLIAAALASPLDLPTLDQALVPDDRVVIALDRDTPCAADIISGMWTWLERREIRPDRVTILAQIAEAADQIDVTRAQAAEKRAKDRLARPTQDMDIQRARLAMLKSVVRQRVASRTGTRG